jgi:hypothetical protein
VFLRILRCPFVVRYRAPFIVEKGVKSVCKRGKLSCFSPKKKKKKEAQFPQLGFLVGNTGVCLFLEACASSL